MRSLPASVGTDLLNSLLNRNSLAAVLSGPREIRTLDLLNAIETRSQLRYGPNIARLRENSYLFSNGPGGIRTLDLFSAIEARSQLRYRPVLHPDFKSQYSNGLNRECQAFLDSPKSALLSRNKKSQSCSGWLSANLDRIKRRYW